MGFILLNNYFLIYLNYISIKAEKLIIDAEKYHLIFSQDKIIFFHYLTFSFLYFSWHFRTDDNIIIVKKRVFIVVIFAPVECLDLLWSFCLNPGHEANLFAPSHFCVNTLLHDLLPFPFSKNTCTASQIRINSKTI